MGCNCKKKNEQVARKYYVPATETEPAQIIETDKPIQEVLKTDCPDCDFKIEVKVNYDGETRET